MTRFRLTSAAALIALGLAACSGETEAPQADAVSDASVDAEIEAPSQASEPAEISAPALPPEIAAVLEQARACNSYILPNFEMPVREDGVSDADYNAAVSAAFLTANAQQPCVARTSTGLQFLIRKASQTGQSPRSGEMVRVHYHGQLIDGTVFDSSYNRFEAAEFPSDRLIAGWVEALPLMREGEAWTLFIAPELGYGMRGAGNDIGPNATLIFDLELLGLPDREQAQ